MSRAPWARTVELIIEGADTEVDKTILEELNDPLVHLLRNAVDHGLEPTADREAAGKPARGTIHLAARQAGDHIIIEITDDGRGMRADVTAPEGGGKGPDQPGRVQYPGRASEPEPDLPARFLDQERNQRSIGPRRRHGRGD